MPTAALRSLLRSATCSDAGTDADLLARFAADRDERTFAELVHRHGALVHGTARRIAGDPDAAHDAFQATFLLLARKASAGGWGPTVGPWLYRVACRVAARARSRMARRPGHAPVADVPGHAPDPGAGLAWADVRGALDRGLASLPARLRDPLVLCYLEGLTRDEAADALGCSPVVLKGRIARGRDRLRRALAGRGITLTAALSGVLVAGNGVSASAAAELAQTAVAYQATRIAPPTVRALLGASFTGWKLFARVTGLLLACATVGLAATGLVPELPQAPLPHPAAPRLLEPAIQLGSGALRHPGALSHLRFSADGRELISYGNGTARRWDARNGKLLGQLGPDSTIITDWTHPTANGAAVIAVRRELSPDRLSVVRVETATGRHEPLFDLPKRIGAPPRNPIQVVTAADDLLARNDDGTVVLWDLRTRKQRLTIDPPGKGHILLFTPDGKQVITAGGDGRTVRFWDVQTGKEVRSLTRAGGQFPQSTLHLVSISADGRWVAALDNCSLFGYGTEVTVWDTKQPDKPQVLVLQEGGGHGSALEFGPGGILYSIDPLFNSPRPMVTKWDLSNGNKLTSWLGPYWGAHRLDTSNASPIAVNSDGSVLAIGTFGGVVRLYDTKTGRELAPTDNHGAEVLSVSFDRTGREVRTVAADGSMTAWNAGTGAARARGTPLDGERLEVPARTAMSMETPLHWILSPDGQWALTQERHAKAHQDSAAFEWTFVLRDAASGKRRVTGTVPGQITELIPVPGRDLLIYRCNAGPAHFI
ncbi:sigma-70 family rna polymerase sigma factor : Uncultured bacterium genome assembly Metasoil_fosmids_resub OS=uncultured bacterium PE=4 SV=1: Sigma70_r2: Sigma70_r4_2 [Gemmata massiliana]|uniref:ECF RNA polymerase sigma factor SigE n=1 Tax=Gemmata massiliana TaxID=1210884 RepID=A0A6P2D4H6_9BACT|nr:sigma-70 family RNA polymerase sigma factor [Gemmata massiliana]VTR96198.1 sigma-70 family rna polymerase sigma factor : Uncultured bacterium genome assembly Metasoil_fosmids_resub OS=uncultured bacterium PE=4 SV=1: Sigma70_r2: Sigma70_r4_2 [Gemmata massiliana]